jgi:hypothetical protein
VLTKLDFLEFFTAGMHSVCWYGHAAQPLNSINARPTSTDCRTCYIALVHALHDLEARVISAVDLIRASQAVENDLIECKRG